jgi:hypothetical protein
MKTYKVTGFYTVTKYVERTVIAENENDAKNKAWSGFYEAETETGQDEGDFEITDEAEEVK